MVHSLDIRYLLLLQDFRNGIRDGLTPFMEMISLFSVTYLILVPAFLYWCVDKRAGLYALTSYYTCCGFNAVVKLSACVFRPWIRDSAVIPAGNAIETATGYSFPSGHTSTAVPIYGAISLTAWKRMRWLSVLSFICMFLTAFSRNYLGVHTPQDVLFAAAEGVLTLWLINILMCRLSAHPEEENRYLLGGVLFCAAALVFITLKDYPIDPAGRVDPAKMMRDGYGDVGMLLAFCIGRYIEKTWIRFRPVLTPRCLAAGMAGIVIAFFLIEILGTPMDLLLGRHWGKLMTTGLITLYIVAGWPAVMKRIAARGADAGQDQV